MPDDGFNLRYARSYLRRKFTTAGVLNLAGLTALADQVAGQAMEEVVVLSNTFEGGSAQAQVKFPKAILGTVLEELIQEAAPTTPREVSQTQAVFQHVTDDDGNLIA